MNNNGTSSNHSTFVISDYLDYLEKSDKDKSKYICPVCGQPKLSIDKTGIKYNCFNCHESKQIAYQLIQKGKTDNDNKRGITNNNIQQEKKPQDNKQENQDNSKRQKSSQEVLKFLRETFDKEIKFNHRTNEVEIHGETFRSDCIRPKLADQYNFDVSENLLTQCILYLALKNTYDPVKDYLERCKWEDPLPLNNVISMIFCTENNLHIQYIRKWLIACVARVYEPGCKFDNALVLQGKQGLGKSSFFEIISNGFFTDSMTGKLDTNDLRVMSQAWVVEWAELDGYTARDYHNKIKPFLTRKSDIYRLPYSKDMLTVPRRSVVVGTTNRDDFLKDSTGERRFWIVPIKDYFNLEGLIGIVPNIWSSVLSLYNGGESWTLPKELWEEQTIDNEDYKLTDPWQDVLIPYLQTQQGMQLTINEIFDKLQDKGIPINFTTVEQMRASDILKSQGWHKQRKLKNGKRQTIWEYEGESYSF